MRRALFEVNTTREGIRGVKTIGNTQLVFLDVPGTDGVPGGGLHGVPHRSKMSFMFVEAFRVRVYILSRLEAIAIRLVFSRIFYSVERQRLLSLAVPLHAKE